MSKKRVYLKIKKYCKRELKKCRRVLKEIKNKNVMKWEKSLEIIIIEVRLRSIYKQLRIIKYIKEKCINEL